MKKSLPVIYSLVAMCFLYGTQLQAAESKPETKDNPTTQSKKAPEAVTENLSDAQIVGILAEAHRSEIRNAETVAIKTQDADVRMFAQMASADHRQMSEQLAGLEKRMNLAPQPSEESKKLTAKGDELYATLKATKDNSVDKKYMDAELSMHKELIEFVDSQMGPQVKNEEIKSLLNTQRAVLQNHLTQVSRVAGKMK